MLDLRIDLADRDADDEELADQADHLRRALADLDVVKVTVPASAAPEGSKGIGADIGALVVTALPGVFSQVVALVTKWLGRRGSRSVKLSIDQDTLEVTDVSAEDSRRLVDMWLARHLPVTS